MVEWGKEERERERRWSNTRGRKEGRERGILSSVHGEKKIRASRRSQVDADREKSIPVREGRSQVERCGEVVRLPFLGCTGAKMIIGRHGNARPASFRFYPSILRRPLRLPTEPCATPSSNPSRSLSSFISPPLSPSLSLSSIVHFLSFFGKGRGGAERMALAKSRSLPFEDLPTGGHLPPSIPPLGKSARG